MQILKQLGEQVVGNQCLIKTSIDIRGPYRSKNIVVLEIDLKKEPINAVCKSIEYDEQMKDKYLRSTRGQKVSVSPFMNLGFTGKFETKTEDLTQLSLEQLIDFINKNSKFKEQLNKIGIKRKISSIITDKAFKNYLKDKKGNSIIQLVYDYLDKNNEILDIIIMNKMIQSYCTYDDNKKKLKFKTPSSLVIAITDNGITKFPGEYKEFNDFYLAMEEADVSQMKNTFACYSCSKPNNLDYNPHIGIFNVDFSGFSLDFVHKKQRQYAFCKNCYNEILKGQTYLGENMNFYAYKIEKTISGEQSINQYILPIIGDPELFKKAVRQITKAKENVGSIRRKTQMEKIKEIEQRIANSSRDMQRKLRTEIAKLKRDLDKTDEELGNRQDLLESLEQLKEQNTSFLYIFYYITDYKQSPPTKEIINTYIVKDSRLKEITRISSELQREFGYTFEFFKLRNIIPKKAFFKLTQVLLEGGTFPYEDFIRNVNNSILPIFSNGFINKEDKGKYRYMLKEFRIVNEFLWRTNVFRRS